MKLSLNIDGVDYTLEELLPMYKIAELASRAQQIEQGAKRQIDSIKKEILEIEPDSEKQLQAVAIVSFILQKFPR